MGQGISCYVGKGWKRSRRPKISNPIFGYSSSFPANKHILEGGNWVNTQPLPEVKAQPVPEVKAQPLPEIKSTSPVSRSKHPVSILKTPETPKSPNKRVRFNFMRESEFPLPTTDSPNLLRTVIDIVLTADVIFKKLNLDDLMTCRLVSKTFNNGVTRTLSTKKDWKILFSFPWEAGKYIRDHPGKETDGKDPPPKDWLDTLNHCLDMTDKGHQFNSFPIKSFDFDVGSLKCPDIMRFFKIFGHQIKFLTLTFMEQLGNYYHCYQLHSLHLILGQIENVEVLDIFWHFVPEQLIIDFLYGLPPIQLKKLKKLQFYGPEGYYGLQLLKRIIRAAPELEEISSEFPHMWKILKQGGLEFSQNSADPTMFRRVKTEISKTK